MAQLNKVFGELVLKVSAVADGVEVRVFDPNQKEQLMLKYNRQDFLVEVDLACKGITTVRAMGLEIQSKESLQALEMAARRAAENMQWVQQFSKTELSKIPTAGN